jgi:hypothetical protein
MKIIITETGTTIEGKGNSKLLLALLVKGISAVMLALLQYPELDVTQAGFLAYQCVSTAADEVLEMTKEKENG